MIVRYFDVSILGEDVVQGLKVALCRVGVRSAAVPLTSWTRGIPVLLVAFSLYQCKPCLYM